MSGQNESGLIATVSITTTPQPGDAVVALREQALSLLEYAIARQIASDDDVKGAVEDLSIISGIKKALEEHRQQYTKPLHAELARVNDTFKMVSIPLEDADKITRDKVKAYNAEQDRKKAEAEAINQQKQEIARREMELHGEILPDTDTKPVEVPLPPARHVYGRAGTSTTTQIWKWEVTDFKALPDEYKQPDAAKITKLVKAGMRTIPGVRIYHEDSLRITPKKG